MAAMTSTNSIISIAAILLFISSPIVHVSSSSIPKRTVIITGANRGVGLAAVKELAATGEWNVVMACRSTARAEEARSRIRVGRENIDIKELDVADLNSVKRFASSWGSKPLHVLACNAGIQKSTNPVGREMIKGDSVERTAQGFESTVGTNHIGHFYLTQLLLDNLKSTASASASASASKSRVVFTGSAVHNPNEPGGDVGAKATLGSMEGLEKGFKFPVSMVDNGEFDPDKAYKDSKLCNVMTSIELARRLASDKAPVTSNVFNPGLIPTTGLFRDLSPVFVFLFTVLTRYIFKVAVSEEEGGRRLAYLIASSALENVNGAYFSGKPGADEFNPVSPSKEAADETKGRRLWELTEQLIKKNT